MPEAAPRSRPRPAPRSAPRPAPDREAKANSEETASDPGLKRLPPVGKPDTQSRAKAERAAVRTDSQIEEVWPRGIEGRPMARIEFSASELVPTGQYANVSVGPAKFVVFVDLDRPVEDDAAYFTESEKAVLVKAANELAEAVEHDVIAVQRDTVLSSLQDQLSTNGN